MNISNSILMWTTGANWNLILKHKFLTYGAVSRFKSKLLTGVLEQRNKMQSRAPQDKDKEPLDFKENCHLLSLKLFVWAVLLLIFRPGVLQVNWPYWDPSIHPIYAGSWGGWSWSQLGARWRYTLDKFQVHPRAENRPLYCMNKGQVFRVCPVLTYCWAADIIP